MRIVRGSGLATRGASTHPPSHALEAVGVGLDAADVLLCALQPGIGTGGSGASVASRRRGPMAEDIHLLFELGGDDASIVSVDASEAAFVAAQGITPG